VAPAAAPPDAPRLSAVSRPWCPPARASTISTAAAATTAAAAAAPWARRARHHTGFGGSSGLGKPWCPNVAACCATVARWATAAGVSLLASLSTCARSPCGMAAMGKQCAQLRALGAAGNVRRLIAHLRQKVQRRGGCARVLAQATMAFVAGHGIQPWPEPALITQSRQLGRRDDEGVLHGVRSICGLVQQGAAVGVQRRRVPVIGLGQPVRIACHNGRNDLAVAHRVIEPGPDPFGQYRNTSGPTDPGVPNRTPGASPPKPVSSRRSASPAFTPRR